MSSPHSSRSHSIFSDSHILVKSVEANIDISRIKEKMTPIDSSDWDDLEDRLLRVLNYKYYEVDVKLLYFNNNFGARSRSARQLPNEGIMQNIIYEDYDERKSSRTPSNVEYMVDLIHSYMPVEQTAEIVVITPDTTCARFWKWMKNVLTFKACRHRS